MPPEGYVWASSYAARQPRRETISVAIFATISCSFAMSLSDQPLTSSCLNLIRAFSFLSRMISPL